MTKFDELVISVEALQTKSSKQEVEIVMLKQQLQILREENIRQNQWITLLSSQQAISSNVNDQLRNEVDRLAQHTRRNCVVIRGVHHTHATESINTVCNEKGERNFNQQI